MVGRPRRQTSVALALWLAAAACGGKSEREDAEGAGAAGGSGASGGSGGSDGSGATGGSGGATGCTHDGVFYELGASFPAGDGCNTCTCQAGGGVACTRTACPTCSLLPELYANALAEAQRCDPRLRVVQCTVQVPSGLACGCPTYVNHDAELLRLQGEWEAQGCSLPILCGACGATPDEGACGADYLCHDVFIGGDP